MKDEFSLAVQSLLRRTAAEVVMPRYQRLAAHEVELKSPGEEVTIADREAELMLDAGLSEILPEARLVGEEACAANPALLDNLDQGTAWIIDPIDGTSNYAAGRPHFALMIGLVADGIAQAGWIYDPLANRMCHAIAGRGAYIDGDRITARTSGSERPIAAISFKFMQPEARSLILAQSGDVLTHVDPPMCAGEQYPRIALGQNDIALYERTLPWDHVPGALFLTEAGGKVARLDGREYAFWDRGTGLLAASNPAIWDRAQQILT